MSFVSTKQILDGLLVKSVDMSKLELTDKQLRTGLSCFQAESITFALSALIQKAEKGGVDVVSVVDIALFLDLLKEARHE